MIAKKTELVKCIYNCTLSALYIFSPYTIIREKRCIFCENFLQIYSFVQDRNTNLNVPNTLLKKDIRDVTAQPTYKVFAVVCRRKIIKRSMEYGSISKEPINASKPIGLGAIFAHF